MCVALCATISRDTKTNHCRDGCSNGLSDRYLNATVTIVAPPGTNASNVQLSEVRINGHSVPADVLDWGLPGVGRSLRSYVIKYAKQYGVTDGEIRDGKVILHTSGY